jgi:hypothetical protein
MKPIKLRTDALTILNVIYDHTAGLPTGCEPYGNGDPIVAVGVTPPPGRLAINQLQGQGGQEF